MNRLNKLIAVGSTVAMTIGMSFAAWAEDPYLLSDSTQVIDTMCRFRGSTTRIELDAQVQGVGDYGLIGTSSKKGELYALIWTQAKGVYSWILRDDDSTWKTADYPVDMERYVYVLDGPNKKMKILSDGKAVYTGDTSGETHTQTSQTLALFGRKNAADGTFNGLATMKFYGLKFYESDVLTHDFIPAKQNNEYGIYDKVTGRFVGRVCGNEFTAGGDVLEVKEAPYLLSDSTQVIDTMCRFRGLTTRIELDAQVQALGDCGLIGTDCKNSSELYVLIWTSASGTYTWQLNNGSKWNATTCPVDMDRHTYVLDGPNEKMKVQTFGEEVFSADASALTHSGTSQTLALFGRKLTASGAFDSLATMKFYGLKFYESDVLTHDFIPAKQNNEYGIYDKVTGRFIGRVYGNEFVAGGDVSEVEEDPYLLSDSTQVIDTMCSFHGSTTRIELDAQVQALGDCGLIGTDCKNSSELYALIWITAGGTYSWQLSNGSKWNVTTCPVDMERHTYVLDGPNEKMKVQTFGEEVFSADASALTHSGTSQTLALFGRKLTASGTFDSLATMKFYGLKIYESDVLTHDFVPAKKGEYGIYDKVTGMFLTRAYGNEFVASGNLPVFEEDGYLQSTGAEYFDTGFCPKGDTRVEVDFALVDTPVENTLYPLFGNAGTKTGCLMFLGYCNGNQGFAHCCQIGKSEWKTSIVKGTKERRTMVLDGKENKFLVLTQGRTNLVSDLTYDHAGGVSAYTMPILAWKDASGTVKGFTAARLYSFKIWDNGALIHSYVPRIDNNVIYLKDMVVGGSDLYPKGTPNNLTVGGMIGSSDPAYLESDGSQYIQTGYKINSRTKLEMDFALMAENGDRALAFGIEEAVAQVHASLYASSGKFGFNYGDSSKWANTTISSDRKRRQLVWTLAEEKAVLKSGTTEEYTLTYVSGAGHSKTATVGMGIFNAFAPTAQDPNAWRPYPAPMRLYSFKIYEDGELVHYYLPYRNGDVVGLKDVAVPGAPILQDVSGSATPFKVGGLGYGDNLEPFYIQPQGGGVPSGEQRVLTVYAPGAISYQWYRNGVPVAGATTAEMVVEWKRRGPDETYAVKAIFDKFGVMVERESAPVTVTHVPSGMLITIH